MNNIQKWIITLATTAVLSSCTLNEGDPQTTVCQKLTTHLMSAQAITWGESSRNPGADKSLNVTVRWDSQDENGTLPMQANCLYLSDEDESGEDYDVNIEDGYQHVPFSMTINGQTIRSQDLSKAVMKVTGQAIKETASKEHLRKKAAEAEQAVRAGAEQVKDKAAAASQAVKEGSEKLRKKAGEALQKAGEALQNNK